MNSSTCLRRRRRRNAFDACYAWLIQRNPRRKTCRSTRQRYHSSPHPSADRTEMTAERPLEENSAADLTTTGAPTTVTMREGDAVEIAIEVESEDSGTIAVVLTIGTTIDHRDSKGESADEVGLKNSEVASMNEAAGEAGAEAGAQAVDETADEAHSVRTTGMVASIIV